MDDKKGVPLPPRYTFSIVHDDEFQPISADSIDETHFRTDPDDWRDTWKKRPPELFRNQLRATPSNRSNDNN